MRAISWYMDFCEEFDTEFCNVVVLFRFRVWKAGDAVDGKCKQAHDT